MTRAIAMRIISAVVGLALVGYGGWLTYAGHADTGSAIIAGGLGTLALPAALSKGGES